jgi:hypothetical protein
MPQLSRSAVPNSTLPDDRSMFALWQTQDADAPSKPESAAACLRASDRYFVGDRPLVVTAVHAADQGSLIQPSRERSYV